MSIGTFPARRMRRLRSSSAIRELLQETRLHPSQLVAPLFVCEGSGQPEPIEGLPGVVRLNVQDLVNQAKVLHDLGIVAVLLFAKVSQS